jgi:hypothetical protein
LHHPLLDALGLAEAEPQSLDFAIGVHDDFGDCILLILLRDSHLDCCQCSTADVYDCIALA